MVAFSRHAVSIEFIAETDQKRHDSRYNSRINHSSALARWQHDIPFYAVHRLTMTDTQQITTMLVFPLSQLLQRPLVLILNQLH